MTPYKRASGPGGLLVHASIGVPEAGFGGVVFVAANRAWVVVVVFERGLHLGHAQGLLRIEQGGDAGFARGGFDQVGKIGVDRDEVGMQAVVGVGQSVPDVGTQNMDLVDCDLHVRRPLGGGEDDVGRNCPRGAGDGGAECGDGISR